jgi:hypothetical protein
MKRLARTWLSVAGVVAIAGSAYAQEPVDIEPGDLYLPERAGIDLTIGGGISGFTSDTLRDTTTDGGSWAARLALGTNTPLSIEASYIGSAQPIDALPIEDDAVLVSNGVQGALRLNAQSGTGVDPFVFGGIAWRRYEIVNEDVDTAVLDESDDVIEFPLGVGLTAREGAFVLDVRGEFRYATEDDMMRKVETFARGDSGDADMHTWGVNLSIGYAL